MSFPAIRLGLLAASAWVGSASAQAVPPDGPPPARPSFDFELGAASDGLFRGVSRTDDRAQAFNSFTQGAALGFIGEPRVNGLAVNRALDARFPVAHPSVP